MDEGSDFRKWNGLVPDVLGLIFKNLSQRELLTVVPRVCKSWRRAVMGPYCWQEMDIVQWSWDLEPETIDRMLRLLITRSSGSLQKLAVSGRFSYKSVMFIADHAQSLRTLRMPRSYVNDTMIEKAAAKLSALTCLDLSYCGAVGVRAIEAIGKHCKSLTSFRRITSPLEEVDKLSYDDEALAIAAMMPGLKHLEIAYACASTSSVIEIIRNCRQLELLDIRGCWKVKLDEKFVKGFTKLKVVVEVNESEIWDVPSGFTSGHRTWGLEAGNVDKDYARLLWHLHR